MPREIIVVGSLNLDLVATVDHHPHPSETVPGTRLLRYPGGKGANQAVAARLLHPHVLMIGRHGTDGFETEPLDALRRHGVDTTGVTPAEGPSGVALVLVAQHSEHAHDPTGGENSIVVIPGANAALSPADLRAHADRISAAALILTQLETPIEALDALLRITTPAKVPVILDPAPVRAVPSTAFPQLAWLTPNEIEAAALLRDAPHPTDASGPQASQFTRERFAAANLIDDPRAAAEQILRLGSQHVLLKLGARGAFLASRDGTRELLPAPQVRAVDTTAAGDCLNGALAAALLDGATPVEAARFGILAAALSVTRHGAIPSLPSRPEIDDFRQKLSQ